jgi:hypothetical protein
MDVVISRPTRKARRPLRRIERALLIGAGLAAWGGVLRIATTVTVRNPAAAARHGSLADVGPWLAVAALGVLGTLLLVLALSGLRRPVRPERLHRSVDVPDGVPKGPGLSTMRTPNWPPV